MSKMTISVDNDGGVCFVVVGSTEACKVYPNGEVASFKDNLNYNFLHDNIVFEMDSKELIQMVLDSYLESTGKTINDFIEIPF